MTSAAYTSLALVAVAASLALTEMLRRYYVACGVLDVPNHRSAHTVPTPRGGGVAIVVTFLGGVVVLALAGEVSRSLAVALCGSGGLVALVGAIDDHRPLPPFGRLIAHFAAAMWALHWTGGLPGLNFGERAIGAGWPGVAIGALLLVWFVNLYNFMDGIDGIAGTEAISVTLGAAAIYAIAIPQSHAWMAPVLLAAASLGFLIRNWAPAAIFMGDAGSGFLGLVLCLFAFEAARARPELFWSWMILLGVFLTDSTLTLARRFANGERVYESHRNHAYQHAARRHGAHIPVTVVVALINVTWLLPIALAVGVARLNPLAGVAIAYGPLLLLGVAYSAGRAPSTR